MEHTEAQWKRILKYLQSGRSLTGYQILVKFDCMNYKGRIHDIRRHGYDVKTEMKEISNGKRIAYYSI
jgi:hypothetical protein